MLRKLLISVAAVVVAVALAVGASLISPLRRPPAQTIDLVRVTKLTCLPSGRALVLGSGPVSIAPVEERPQAGEPAPLDQAIEVPSVVTANSHLVAGVLTPAPAVGYTACAAPMPTGLLQAIDPASTELLLVNPDANEAAVDLSLLGPDGELTPVGARGIAVAPGSTRTIALSVLAPKGPVGVLYTTSQGRVAVLLKPVEGRPAPNGSASVPAPATIIGGIPAAGATARLILSNPNDDRLDVTVNAIGATATYEPAAAAGLSLPPHSTISVDIGGSLGGEASALRVEASEPVGATVVVGQPGTEAVLSASDPATELGVYAADVSAVQISNPGPRPAAARISVGDQEQRVQVEPGTTVSVAVAAAAPSEVHVSADQAVVASAVSATGTVIYPLGATEVDEATAGVVAADPTLR